MFESLQRFISESEYVLHETKHSALIRYVSVLFIVAAYLAIVVWNHGLEDGLLITALTWSFFVFCTPVADAGFLLDFPVRLLTGLRMVYSELVVWLVAFTVTVDAYLFTPHVFHETVILNVFDHILTKPFPYWFIVFLSAAGTFMSVYFGDELLDVASHDEREKHSAYRGKYRFVVIVFFFLVVIALYEYLLTTLGITIL